MKGLEWEGIYYGSHILSFLERLEMRSLFNTIQIKNVHEEEILTKGNLWAWISDAKFRWWQNVVFSALLRFYQKCDYMAFLILNHSKNRK